MSQKKPNVITLRVPLDLKQRLVSLAEQQGVSMNQLAIYILTKELAFFESPAVHLAITQSPEALKRDFKEVMAKISGSEDDLPDWDRMPPTP